MHEAVKFEKREVINVNSITFSEIVKDDKIALIFMDVEGAENLILESSKEIILKDRPCICCECNDKLLRNFSSSSFELIQSLKKLGYNITNVETKKSINHYPFNGNILGIA